MKTLNSKRLLAGLMIAGMAACGGGSKKNSGANGDTPTATENKDLVGVDEGNPSIDDKSQASNKGYVMAASLAGLGIGTVLLTWSPSKVEALRKFLISIDHNEAMKINGKLLELVNARQQFDQISKTLPTQVEDVLKGSVESAESEKIKDKLLELFAKRNQKLNEISSIKSSIANVEAAAQKPATSGAALEIKNGSTSLGNYLDALYAQKPEAQVSPEYNKAAMTRMQQDLSLANTGLGQIDNEIAKALKSNARIFKIFQTWDLAKNRVAQVAKSFDLNFHRVFRGLIRKMISAHSDRVKLKIVDADGNRVDADSISAKKASIDVIGAKLVKKNFNLARVAYMTAGGFVIVGSGYTLWTTLSESDTEGHEMALSVIEAIHESEELPTQEEAAELSNTK